MFPSRSLASLVALSTLTLGCATTRSFDRSTEPGGKPLPTITTAGSVILTGDDLAGSGGWTILEALKRAMPQMRVSDWTQPNGCPVLELRGKDTLLGDSNPDVYVDGTRTVDTCPLVTLLAMETRRIEVYPLGVTVRPGYSSRGHGLILVFMQRAGS